MDDRDYFSDWGSCTCNDPDWDYCLLSEYDEHDDPEDED
jgi:hypothetical protein